MDEDFKQRLEAVYIANYTMYYRLALRLLRTYTGQTDHAADIVHEAFILAEIKREQSSIYLEKWLSKTILNLCRNYSKGVHVRQQKMKDLIEDQPKPDPVQSFETVSDIMMSLQQRLSSEDYQLFLKYCVEHRPIENISRKTGITPNAIRVRIYRIKKVVEQILLTVFVIIMTFQYIL